MIELRPFYETEKDRARQRAFASFIEKKWKCILKELGIEYRVDYAMMLRGNNRIIGWLELKCRKNSSTAFNSYMISHRKWMYGIQCAETSCKPFVIAVEYTDNKRFFFIYEPGFTDYEIRFQGRTIKTRDSQDIEPCVFIPNKYFREFL